jgi:Pyruvate/2-oxoacid:ferredoxin oxidoreductase delta subunit
MEDFEEYLDPQGNVMQEDELTTARDTYSVSGYAGDFSQFMKNEYFKLVMPSGEETKDASLPKEVRTMDRTPPTERKSPSVTSRQIGKQSPSVYRRDLSGATFEVLLEDYVVSASELAEVRANSGTRDQNEVEEGFRSIQERMIKNAEHWFGRLRSKNVDRETAGRWVDTLNERTAAIVRLFKSKDQISEELSENTRKSAAFWSKLLNSEKIATDLWNDNELAVIGMLRDAKLAAESGRSDYFEKYARSYAYQCRASGLLLEKKCDACAKVSSPSPKQDQKSAEISSSAKVLRSKVVLSEEVVKTSKKVSDAEETPAISGHSRGEKNTKEKTEDWIREEASPIDTDEQVEVTSSADSTHATQKSVSAKKSLPDVMRSSESDSKKSLTSALKSLVKDMREADATIAVDTGAELMHSLAKSREITRESHRSKLVANTLGGIMVELLQVKHAQAVAVMLGQFNQLVPAGSVKSPESASPSAPKKIEFKFPWSKDRNQLVENLQKALEDYATTQVAVDVYFESESVRIAATGMTREIEAVFGVKDRNPKKGALLRDMNPMIILFSLCLGALNAMKNVSQKSSAFVASDELAYVRKIAISVSAMRRTQERSKMDEHKTFGKKISQAANSHLANEGGKGKTFALLIPEKTAIQASVCKQLCSNAESMLEVAKYQMFPVDFESCKGCEVQSLAGTTYSLDSSAESLSGPSGQAKLRKAKNCTITTKGGHVVKVYYVDSLLD